MVSRPSTLRSRSGTGSLDRVLAGAGPGPGCHQCGWEGSRCSRLPGSCRSKLAEGRPQPGPPPAPVPGQAASLPAAMVLL